MNNFNESVNYIKANDIDNLKKILEEDLNLIHKKNDWDRTLLHYAAESGNLDIVKMLINYGADLNVKNILDWTPLHRSIEKRNPDIAKYLILKGADVNVKDNMNNTALHYAAEKGYIDIAKLLILKGVDLCLKNNKDKTPLDYVKDDKFRNELIFIYKNKERFFR